MRFSVELLLNNEKIPKDKNKIILSILKRCFKDYDQKYYEKLYKISVNKVKDFTFALYLGHCKFLKEEIVIPTKKIILNFSSYNIEDGIMFYNAILNNKGINIPIKNNSIMIGKINLIKETTIQDHQIIFKTMSPIVVREHKGKNQKTWYHSLKSNDGQTVFRKNLKHQLFDIFGDRALYDFEEIKVDISEVKIVKVKNYGIEVHGNIGTIRISGPLYILDYLYKAGIGSKRGSGFGMVEII